MSEYIEFKVNSQEKFAKLQKVFGKIKIDKDNDSFDEDSIYLEYFDEEAKSFFGWYSNAENEEWAKKWFSTPVETRWTEPNLQRKWDFGSMLDCFKNGEYELLSCELISHDTARLNFIALAYPYGGTGCMQTFINSFGFEIIETNE